MVSRENSLASDKPVSPESLAREGYARHGGELYRFALSRLRDEGAAQDAVQETIVRAWRAGDRFDPATATLRTWLFAILKNVIIDQARSRARTPISSDNQDGREDEVMTDHADTLADTDLLTRALGLISHDHRTAIVETYLRDRSYDDVAAELGVSVSTLRSRVFHGLKQLRLASEMMVIEQ